MRQGHYQSGYGLPVAIFVVTTMLVISIAIGKLNINSSESQMEEQKLVQALFAAESAAGLAMNALFPPASYPDGYQPAAACAVTRDYEFTVPGLANCSATVSCSVDGVIDDIEYFTLISSGTCDGVSRRLQVRTRFEAQEP
jgi:MSHA biogenesis protein MshP